jgi:hypothetical protein
MTAGTTQLEVRTEPQISIHFDIIGGGRRGACRRATRWWWNIGGEHIGASLQAELQFADLPSVHPAIGISADLESAQACTQTGRNLHIHPKERFNCNGCNVYNNSRESNSYFTNTNEKGL